MPPQSSSLSVRSEPLWPWRRPHQRQQRPLPFIPRVTQAPNTALLVTPGVSLSASYEPDHDRRRPKPAIRPAVRDRDQAWTLSRTAGRKEGGEIPRVEENGLASVPNDLMPLYLDLIEADDRSDATTLARLGWILFAIASEAQQAQHEAVALLMELRAAAGAVSAGEGSCASVALLRHVLSKYGWLPPPDATPLQVLAESYPPISSEHRPARPAEDDRALIASAARGWRLHCSSVSCAKHPPRPKQHSQPRRHQKRKVRC
jgi:hypothetical protein